MRFHLHCAEFAECTYSNGFRCSVIKVVIATNRGQLSINATKRLVFCVSPFSNEEFVLNSIKAFQVNA